MAAQFRMPEEDIEQDLIRVRMPGCGIWNVKEFIVKEFIAKQQNIPSRTHLSGLDPHPTPGRLSHRH